MKRTLTLILLAFATSGSALADQYTNQPDQNTNQLYYAAGPTDDSYAQPEAGHVGVGVIFGEPIGADVKYWLGSKTAVDGAVGWSGRSHSTLYAQGDFLWHKFGLANFLPVSGKFPVYFGVGGLLRLRDHGRSDQAGIRIPIGISYIFQNWPVDVFAEVGPAIDLTPGIGGEITGGIGVRFWF